MSKIDEYYLGDPKLRDYYRSMPGTARSELKRQKLSIGTLGELQLWAEHYQNLEAMAEKNDLAASQRYDSPLE